MKTLNGLIGDYTRALQVGEIQIAYRGILAFLGKLRTAFLRSHPDWDAGSLYQGYLDMSYFSVSTEELKTHGLKVAVVYLHEQDRFEVWLSARNREVGRYYSAGLSHETAGMAGHFHDPHNPDAIIEVILAENPDFDEELLLQDSLLQGVEAFIDWLAIQLEDLERKAEREKP